MYLVLPNTECREGKTRKWDLLTAVNLSGLLHHYMQPLSQASDQRAQLPTSLKWSCGPSLTALPRSDLTRLQNTNITEATTPDRIHQFPQKLTALFLTGLQVVLGEQLKNWSPLKKCSLSSDLNLAPQSQPQ